MTETGEDAGAVGMHVDDMLRLKQMHLAPYLQLATVLIGNLRRSGGNMFRHQIDTMAILLDYGYIDSVLLKASIIHDLIEDVPGFDRDRILEIDEESADVFKLVLEVTRRPIETKAEFLARIRDFGSDKARVLKSADRISNMISLGYVTDFEFVRRYTDETESQVFSIYAGNTSRAVSKYRGGTRAEGMDQGHHGQDDRPHSSQGHRDRAIGA